VSVNNVEYLKQEI